MKTLAGPVGFVEEIRRSRFLAHADRADDPEQALAFIAARSDPAATHNCWAYRIGDEYRFNDDGEPGGSAGRPIHAAIEGASLDHVVVLVIRHFGGVKLGVGGLARAYGGCAARCLERAEVVTVRPRETILLRVGFEAVAQVHARFEAFAVAKLSEDYRTDGVSLKLTVPETRSRAFRDAILDATRGAAEFESLESGSDDG